MIILIHLSQSAVSRLVKYQILTQFQPVDTPFEVQGVLAFMDGVHVDPPTFKLPDNSFQADFVLNNLDSSGKTVGPASASAVANPLRFPAVKMELSGKILMASSGAVQNARVPQPQPGGEPAEYPPPPRETALDIPIANLVYRVDFSVSPAGVPSLNLTRFGKVYGEDEHPSAKPFLDRVSAISVPLDLSAALSEALGPSGGVVLNAGITYIPGGQDTDQSRFAIRLECAPVEASAYRDMQRRGEWADFFAGQVAAVLGGRDWAIEIPSKLVLDAAGARLDKTFASPDLQKYFTKTARVWGWFSAGHPPGMTLVAAGVVNSICGGMDVKAEISASASLFVPSSNVIRVSAELDIDVDDWDSFKCTLLSLLNPIAGAITTADLHWPFYWSFVVQPALMFAPILRLYGIDDFGWPMLLKEAQKSDPAIVRTGASTFYVDTPLSVASKFTQNWLSIDDIAGYGVNLVLRGAFTAPDLDTLPRLKGTLVEPFDEWSTSKCHPGPLATSATIQLSLVDEQQKHVTKSPIKIRYGIQLLDDGSGGKVPGGSVTWRIVDDANGVYAGNSTERHWSGIPGTFDVKVVQPPEPFKSVPYPFRLKFFTSFGVREFEVPAPPPFPPPPSRDEAIAIAAQRISDCYIYSSLLTRVRALQVLWLPRPPETEAPAQHWRIRVDNVPLNERVRAWDARGREPLAEAVSTDGQRVELSLVVQADRALAALQITLNDEPPLAPEEYAKRVARLRAPDAPGAHPVRIWLTALQPVASFDLPHHADTIVLQRSAESIRMITRGAAGSFGHEVSAGEPWRLVAVSSNVEDEAIASRAPSRRVAWAGQIAAHPIRSWYEGGDVAGRFFAQLDRDGRRVRLYHRGTTREVNPDAGRARRRS